MPSLGDNRQISEAVSCIIARAVVSARSAVMTAAVMAAAGTTTVTAAMTSIAAAIADMAPVIATAIAAAPTAIPTMPPTIAAAVADMAPVIATAIAAVPAAIAITAAIAIRIHTTGTGDNSSCQSNNGCEADELQSACDHVATTGHSGKYSMDLPI
jgi:hypothetical protein